MTAALPAYLTYAKTWDGVREVPGTKANPLIVALWAAEAWLGDDDSKVPWCGLFLRKCMQETGFPYPSAAYRAASWQNWGVPILTPAVGAVGIMARKGGNHVAIAVGITADGKVAMLGGNQGDAVRVSTFPLDRIDHWRWPSGWSMPSKSESLPLLSSSGIKPSASEA